MPHTISSAALRRCVYIFVLCFLSSCFSTGRNFPSKLDWITKDVTTQKDVEMVLGAPFSVGNSGGVATATYAYYEYHFGGTNVKELKFYWNSNNTVQHYTFTSSFPGDVKGK